MPLQLLSVSKEDANKDIASTHTTHLTIPPWAALIDIVPADVEPLSVIPVDVALIDVILGRG